MRYLEKTGALMTQKKIVVINFTRLSLVFLLGVTTSIIWGCDQNSGKIIPKKSQENVIKKRIDLPKKRVFKIGILYWSMNIPGQVAMRKGVEKTAREINKIAQKKNLSKIELIPMVAGDGAMGIERQIKQMEKFIDQKIDLIIVQPTDIAALSESLKRANKFKIPVVAYDQHIIGGKLSAYITSNNYQAGYLDGEYVATQFPNNKILQIVLIEYPHVSSTVERIDGFIDALEHYKQRYKVRKTYQAVDPVSGTLAGEKFLEDFPKKNSIDLIFAVNDGGGLAVITALKKAKRFEIFFASVDGDPQSVENIKKGDIFRIDSAQFCGEIGAEAMRTAYKILYGEKVSQKKMVPVFPITRETVQQYQGWNAPMPQPFKKPWRSDPPIWSNKIISITTPKDK